jgi:hypothetical protein
MQHYTERVHKSHFRPLCNVTLTLQLVDDNTTAGVAVDAEEHQVLRRRFLRRTGRFDQLWCLRVSSRPQRNNGNATTVTRVINQVLQRRLLRRPGRLRVS